MTWSLMHNVPIILDPVCFVFCNSNLPPSLLWVFSSVQSSSVAQSCLTLCDTMIHHQLPESRSCCWEGFGAGGGGDARGWDGWMASPTRWEWVWVNSGSWWWTERPGVLQFMGSQRVGHDWATELNWTEPNPCPLSQWCHPAISSPVVPFSSCLQSFPTSGSFQMSQLFTSGGQIIGVSASTSVLPMNTQGYFCLIINLLTSGTKIWKE